MGKKHKFSGHRGCLMDGEEIQGVVENTNNDTPEQAKVFLEDVNGLLDEVATKITKLEERLFNLEQELIGVKVQVRK